MKTRFHLYLFLFLFSSCFTSIYKSLHYRNSKSVFSNRIRKLKRHFYWFLSKKQARINAFINCAQQIQFGCFCHIWLKKFYKKSGSKTPFFHKYNSNILTNLPNYWHRNARSLHKLLELFFQKKPSKHYLVPALLYNQHSLQANKSLGSLLLKFQKFQLLNLVMDAPNCLF